MSFRLRGSKRWKSCDPAPVSSSAGCSAPASRSTRRCGSWRTGPRLGALLKLVVTVTNVTDWSPVDASLDVPRDVAVRHSLVAVHIMLAVDDAVFLSLLDPPDHTREAVNCCVNDGTFPVLVGTDDTVVLSSPIILYDHPEIAPESDGPLYDSTEIDEMLALRVLTLTDDEKAEAPPPTPRRGNHRSHR